DTRATGDMIRHASRVEYLQPYRIDGPIAVRGAPVRFAINVPNFGASGDPHLLIELAEETEDAGWDGFFIWDHVQSFVPGQRVPMVDPWVALGAIAMAT